MNTTSGPQSPAAVFVKPSTLSIEIPVLNAKGQHRYTGRCNRTEFLTGENREAQLFCFQMPVELTTSNGARESTVHGVSSHVRLGQRS